MPPKPKAVPEPVTEYVVAVRFERREPDWPHQESAYEVGEPYDGPDLEQYAEWQLVVPADAGSGQPGSEDEGA